MICFIGGIMTTLSNYVLDLKLALDQLPLAQVNNLATRLHQARLAGQRVFVFGNGGSASTASHLACDLGKNTVVDQLPRLRALALTDNMALFSANANDLGYQKVFAEQLISFVEPNDIVIAISASGNSPNVLEAVALARHHQAYTVGWSGYEGGKLAQLVDLPIVVRSHCIEQIEDAHLVLAHLLTVAVRQQAVHAFMAPAALGEMAHQRLANGAFQANGVAVS
jgi:D-sedoheptulose 7-phosphate isomerase